MNDFLILESDKKKKEYFLSWSKNNNTYISLIKYSEKKEYYYKKKLIYKIDLFQKDLNNFFKHYNKNSLLKVSWRLNNVQDNNLYDQNYLFDLYKVIILEDFCKKNKIIKITLNGANKKIKNIINVFCKEKKIELRYIYQKNKHNNTFNYKSLIKKIIPNFFLTIVRLNIFLILRLPIFFRKEKKIKKDNKFNLLFVSYLSNLTKKGIEQKYFGSTYWDDLDNQIASSDIQKNWLFLYTPEFKIDKKNFQIFSNNSNKKINSEYIILDCYFNFKLLANLYVNLFKNFIISFFITRILKKKFLYNYCFEIYKNDINQNIFGFKILKSIYFDKLMESFFLKNKLKFNKIIYLYENQSWERSLIKHSKSKNCLAFLHASLRFWDLRYLNLKSQFDTSKGDPKKKILVCSNYYKRFLNKHYGIKSTDIILVEYLKKIKTANLNIDKKKIIVIGDYKDESNMSLKQILIQLNKKRYNNFIVKPHPLNFRFFKKLKNELNLNIRENVTYDNYKFFLVTNSTSLGLELLLQKKNVFTILNDDYFNLSPIKHFVPYNNFIHPNFKIFDHLPSYDKKNVIENFYIKNKNLKNWKKILLN